MKNIKNININTKHPNDFLWQNMGFKSFKSIKIFSLAVLTCAAMLMPAHTALASQCYKPKEAEAEQGIRIHSELMVIGLNCQHMSSAGEKNLYIAYREFIGRHSELFAAYETILLEYYKGAGVLNPEAELNTMRTNFANKISNDAAVMRPDLFCSRYAPRISKVVDMQYHDLRRWAATIYPSHPVSRPLCSS